MTLRHRGTLPVTTDCRRAEDFPSSESNIRRGRSGRHRRGGRSPAAPHVPAFRIGRLRTEPPWPGDTTRRRGAETRTGLRKQGDGDEETGTVVVLGRPEDLASPDLLLEGRDPTPGGAALHSAAHHPALVGGDVVECY